MGEGDAVDGRAAKRTKVGRPPKATKPPKAERPPKAGAQEIYWRAWLPDGRPSPRAAVVIAHGAGEHSGRYDAVAGRLVSAGYTVYALDHRGHGRSGGPRALIPRLEMTLVDLYQLVAGAAQKAGGRPPFLLGHSMGGTIAMSFALEWPEQLAGLILSSPLASLPQLRPPAGLVVSVLSRVAPKLGVSAVDPSLVSRDPEQVKAYETDPLVLHGRLPVRTIAELHKATRTFPKRASELTLPLLILSAGADRIVAPSGAKTIYDGASSKDKTLKVYPDLYHEIFNETEPDRSLVLDDLIAWLDART